MRSRVLTVRSDCPAGGSANLVTTPGADWPLARWLEWQQQLHGSTIALGLERVAEVWARLPPSLGQIPVVTVAGTNGKGSVVAYLEAIYGAAGYRVGAYTSPHLFHYRERVRIGGAAVGDADLCAAFAAVEGARGKVPLTYFEFGTLAALWLFATGAGGRSHDQAAGSVAAPAPLDVVLLEVGLGGRLDAVNIVDPSLAIITSIDLDHSDWLGDTRDSVAREKAGILRPRVPAVCGDPQPPPALLRAAADVEARLYRLEEDFTVAGDHGWHWHPSNSSGDMAVPRGAVAEGISLATLKLSGAHQRRNAATTLAAVTLLQDRLPVSAAAAGAGLAAATLPGRLQCPPSHPDWICDVAHNPAAALALAGYLGSMGGPPVALLMGVLATKDISGMAAALAPVVDRWHLAASPDPRAMTVTGMRAKLRASGVPETAITSSASVAEAVACLSGSDYHGHRKVVCGSFALVAQVLTCLAASSCPSAR